jgi:hypothetical protein
LAKVAQIGWGPRDGIKRHRECAYGAGLGLLTALVWTRLWLRDEMAMVYRPTNFSQNAIQFGIAVNAIPTNRNMTPAISK